MKHAVGKDNRNQGFLIGIDLYNTSITNTMSLFTTIDVQSRLKTNRGPGLIFKKGPFCTLVNVFLTSFFP